MSSLSFIPRKLAKGKTTQKARPPLSQSNVSEQLTSVLTPSSATTLVTSTPKPPISEKSSRYEGQDYANLIALSLSDYSLWLDAELRQKTGIGTQPLSNQNSGYVSLNYLLDNSAALASICDSKSDKEPRITRSQVQAAIVKGIRACASHLLEVRLLLHPDETVPHFGKQNDIAGGYEVRRKRVGLVMRGKNDWDACTLYLENIPPGFRSYAEIIQFLGHLLSDASPIPSTSTLRADSLTRIQSITFPPHYSDNPGTRPSCKGFALVTFAHSMDCDHLKDRWPWFREAEQDTKMEQRMAAEGTEVELLSIDTVRLAQQHNFRVITKERWLQLKAEYLAYRQQLVEKMNTYQDSQPTQPRRFRDTEQPAPDQDYPIQTGDKPSTPSSHRSAVPLDSTAPYPPNCLLFVKNIHPETTKTTLRSLLSQALLPKDAQSSRQKYEGLDYVDFNKGMDTCYLRLATPIHTAALVKYFDHQNRQVAQESGMDETGVDLVLGVSPSVLDLKPIIVTSVTGRPEEIYWEKVPVKIKRAAVAKAIEFMKDEYDVVDSKPLGHKRALDIDDRSSSKTKKIKL